MLVQESDSIEEIECRILNREVRGDTVRPVFLQVFRMRCTMVGQQENSLTGQNRPCTWRSALGILMLLMLAVPFSGVAQKKRKALKSNPLRDSVEKYAGEKNWERALTFSDLWCEKTRKKPGRDSLEFAESLFHRGITLRGQGKFAEAEVSLAKVLAIQERVVKPADTILAASLRQMALVKGDQKQFDSKLGLLDRALQIHLNQISPNKIELAKIYNDLGAANFYLNRFEEAERVYLAALKIRREVYGQESQTTSSVLFNLGLLYKSRKKFDEA